MSSDEQTRTAPADAAADVAAAAEVATPTTPDPEGHRSVSTPSLKALAHPLRVGIFDALSTYGPATASGLAERFGESSGATSYHLRQLEKHGFVREVEGRGTARERWWERVPGSVSFGDAASRETESGRAAGRIIARELAVSREQKLRDFIERGDDVLDENWREAGTISLTNLMLTADQLRELVDQLDALAVEFGRRFRGQNVPGMRPVQIHMNAFPVIDGEITPDSASSGAEAGTTAGTTTEITPEEE